MRNIRFCTWISNTDLSNQRMQSKSMFIYTGKAFAWRLMKHWTFQHCKSHDLTLKLPKNFCMEVMMRMTWSQMMSRTTSTSSTFITNIKIMKMENPLLSLWMRIRLTSTKVGLIIDHHYLQRQSTQFTLRHADFTRLTRWTQTTLKMSWAQTLRLKIQRCSQMCLSSFIKRHIRFSKFKAKKIGRILERWTLF